MSRHPVARATVAGTLLAAFFLTSTAMLPSAVFFLARASSQALGLLLVIPVLAFLVALGAGVEPRQECILNAVLLAAVVMVFIMVHITVAGLWVEPGFGRAASSAALLGGVIVGAAALRDTFFRWPDVELGQATMLVRLFFITAGTLAIAGIQPLTAGVERPIFPFTEPSHFALAFTPFIIHGSVRNRGWRRLAMLGSALVLAYALKSLSLMVAVVIAAAISLQLWAMALAATAVIAAVSVLDVSYFADRLQFDPTNENLSRLVYVQGWELISSSLRNTSGWGAGFQDLGFVPVQSPTADQIYRLLNNDSNLKDGGFTAAKLVSEFGIFGAAILAWLVATSARACLRLRSAAMGHVATSEGTILAWSVMAGAFVELFVRGIGYFSPTTFFYAAAAGYGWSVTRLSHAVPTDASMIINLRERHPG